MSASNPVELKEVLKKLDLWPKSGAAAPLPEKEMRRQIGTMVKEMDGEILAGAFYSMLMLTALRLEEERRP